MVAGRDEWELARTWCVKQSADEEMLVSDLVLLSGKRSLSNLWSGTFFFGLFDFLKNLPVYWQTEERFVFT